MFCKQCGTVVPEGRTSCPMCGKSVEQGGADAPNISGLMQMPRSGGSGGNEKPGKEMSLPMLIGAVAVILGVIVIAVLIFRGKGDSDKDDRGSNRDEQKEENTVDLEELEDDLRGEWVCQGNAEAFTRAYAEKFADDAYTASLDWAEEMVKAEEDSQYLYEEFLDEMGSREDFMEKMFDDVDESELEAMEAIRFQNGRFGMCADGEWLETENDDDVVALELSYRIVDEETLEIQTSFEMMDEDYPLTIDSSFEVGFRLDGDELILEVDREEVQFERD